MLSPHKNKNNYSVSGKDVREIPAYNVTEAARHLNMPLETLRSWVKGRYYPVGKNGEKRFFQPAIFLPEGSSQLSFINLIEAHVLDGMRRQHSVPFYNVRRALDTLKEQFPSEHPLADIWFQTDGFDLFIEDYLGRIINLSQSGQIELRELIQAYLKRIDRDVKGVPTRLYPVVKTRTVEEPPLVVIDPLISFGRPVLVGSGIPTSIIAERFYAGDSTDVLAKDYGRERSEIEEAVQYEAPTRKAA